MRETIHVYEVRPRKEKRGVDLISNALQFRRCWYCDCFQFADAKDREQPLPPTGVVGFRNDARVVKACAIQIVQPRYRIQDRARIVFDCRTAMMSLQPKGKGQMKTILLLIVGLMLAGCGSMGSHVRNGGVASTPVPDPGDTIAVNTICACP